MRLLALALILGLAAGHAAAEPAHSATVRSLVESNFLPRIRAEVVLAAIRAHNARRLPTDEASIARMEEAWREQRLYDIGDLMRGVENSDASAYLRRLKRESRGVITEILIMGDDGYLVAQSDMASDYFQGDEAKFQKTAATGAETVFVDEIHFDASVLTHQAQVSFTIADPVSGAIIGAATVGVAADVLR